MRSSGKTFGRVFYVFQKSISFVAFLDYDQNSSVCHCSDVSTKIGLT